MTGQPVPADDLPSAGAVPVPPDDLPVTGTSAAPQKGFTAGEYLHPRNIAAGPEAALSIASGAGGQVLGGLAGLAGAVLPGETGQGARWSERVSSALTYEPRTPGGKTLMNIIGIPGEVIEGVAENVGSRGAEMSPTLGTIGKTAVHALPVLLGMRATTAPKAKLTPKQAAAGEAMDAGFRLTPEEMGAGPVARTAASLSGEPRLGKLNTKKNQGVVNDKIATDLGLPKGTPLDLDVLQRIRAEAGQAYEGVRGSGVVATDATYMSDLAKIGQKYQTVSKDFPEVSARTGAGEAQAIVEGLKKQAFDANSAVDLINQLRRSADDAFRSSKTDVAKAMRAGAEAVEGMLERHLGALGDTEAMAALRSARERIAKTYVAEKALVGDNINPQVYAKEHRKRKPLDGGAAEVGQAADKFERSLAKPTNQATGASFWDLALPALWGGIKELALAGVRPAMRSAMSSRPGQYLMDPRTNLATPTQQALGIGSIPRPQEETR